MQLRLQQTVEGLSVLAISYYAIGIIGYIMKPVMPYLPGLDSSSLLGMAAPAIVLAVWYFVRRLRRIWGDPVRVVASRRSISGASCRSTASGSLRL